MTITDGYCTQLEAKAWLNMADASLDDLIVDNLVNTASRAIDGYTGRVFTADANTSAQVYLATDLYCVEIDDVWETSSVVVKTDAGQDGTYETTLASTSYYFEPVNGVAGGISGWPATKIRLVGGIMFPYALWGRPQVQVTAKWGWATVPAPVKQATLQLVAELWKRKDAGPYGTIGSQEFGSMILSENPMRPTARLLAPYRTGSAVAAMA